MFFRFLIHPGIFIVAGLFFSIGCSDEKTNSSDEALQEHLTNFSISAAKSSENLSDIVETADAINVLLEFDDFETADLGFEVLDAELAELAANIESLEVAEAGIRDVDTINKNNIAPYSSEIGVQRLFFTVLAGTALFTYGTKSLMGWLKNKSDECSAARRERDDALEDIGNGVDGAEDVYNTAKQKQKTIGLEVIDKLSKTVVTTAVTSVASPVTLAGVAIKEVAGKVLDKGLDVLSATKECSGGADAAGCVIGATKTDSSGKADVPAGIVDVVVSGPSMARVQVLDVEAAGEKTLLIPKTNIKDATKTSIEQNTIGDDFDVADTDWADSDTTGDDTSGLTTLCDDSCASAGDGECDDGGEGALYTDCVLGSDCSDCGERVAVIPVDTAEACSGSGSSGAYPASVDDFNGLQVNYAIGGVCLDVPVESDGFTITRNYPVLGINGDTVTISGSTAPNSASCNSDSGSFWFQTEVTLTVNGVSDTYTSPEPCVQSNVDPYSVEQPSFTFDLSVPAGSYGDSVSFSVAQIYVNPLYGNRVVEVIGTTAY